MQAVRNINKEWRPVVKRRPDRHATRAATTTLPPPTDKEGERHSAPFDRLAGPNAPRTAEGRGGCVEKRGRFAARAVSDRAQRRASLRASRGSALARPTMRPSEGGFRPSVRTSEGGFRPSAKASEFASEPRERFGATKHSRP